MSIRSQIGRQSAVDYVSSSELIQNYVKERRKRREASGVFMLGIRESLSAKLEKAEPPSLIIASRLQKLRDQLKKLFPVPESESQLNSGLERIPKEVLIIRAVCDLVEQHLNFFTLEFPGLYSADSGSGKQAGRLERHLSMAAKAQEASLGKCYSLLTEFETLIQTTARPLIERYDTKNSQAISNNRINALHRLRSILPEQYAAPNGRPVEQVKHVLAKQLEQIFLRHDLPIKQSSRNADSIAFEISKAVRAALEFHRFDMSESLKTKKRRSTPR